MVGAAVAPKSSRVHSAHHPAHAYTTAPELLQQLFERGTLLLLQSLPEVLAGRGAELAAAQDEAKVVHADKLDKAEAELDVAGATAQVCAAGRCRGGGAGVKGNV
eukprot:361841-Chlamydomonas_euryale.AAC.2